MAFLSLPSLSDTVQRNTSISMSKFRSFSLRIFTSEPFPNVAHFTLVIFLASLYFIYLIAVALTVTPVVCYNFLFVRLQIHFLQCILSITSALQKHMGPNMSLSEHPQLLVISCWIKHSNNASVAFVVSTKLASIFYIVFFSYHYFSDLHAGKPFCLILRLDFLAFLPWGLTHAGSSVCHCQISIKFYV